MLRIPQGIKDLFELAAIEIDLQLFPQVRQVTQSGDLEFTDAIGGLPLLALRINTQPVLHDMVDAAVQVIGIFGSPAGTDRRELIDVVPETFSDGL